MFPTLRILEKSVVLLKLSLPLGFDLYGLYSHFRSLNSNAISQEIFQEETAVKHLHYILIEGQ